MAAPEAVTPDIIAGRRVRRIDLDVTPGMSITVLEAADADVVLEESIQLEGDPYAAILWPSAVAAAARVATIVRRGDTVLDLGAGTGLAALTAARCGARAIALDHDPFARAVVSAAAAMQKLNVEVRAFDVRSHDPLPAGDIVVLADLLYELELAHAAARRTREALAAGARVVIGDPARYGRMEYQRLLAEAGISVTFEDVLVPLPGESRPARVGLAVLTPRS
jgi:predicted nicotinamide N-methyase